MHCFGEYAMHPRSIKLVSQLVRQASKGDTINIWCPETRYILSLIVNKISYSKDINITWIGHKRGVQLQPCLTPAKHLLKTLENIHTMEKCLVWHPIVFPPNSRLLEWKLTAPTFNISQFLTLHIMLPNKYGQPPFLLGFVIVNQTNRYLGLAMDG